MCFWEYNYTIVFIKTQIVLLTTRKHGFEKYFSITINYYPEQLRGSTWIHSRRQKPMSVLGEFK